MEEIRKWCYGGQDKQFFTEHMAEINKHNIYMTDVFMNVIPALVLVYFIDYFFMKKDYGISSACAIYLIVLIISRVLSQMFIKGRVKNSYLYMLVNFELFIVFLVMVGPIFDPENIACFIPAFAAVVFIFPIIPMHLIFIEVFSNIIVIIVLDFIFKDQSLAIIDTFNVIACAIVGFCLGRGVLGGRLEVIKSYDAYKGESTRKIIEAEKKALIDGLTGLGNRTAAEVVRDKMDERIRKCEDPFFAVLICDVNGLKDKNDSEGHEAGDRYLIFCADKMKSVLKNSEVFRFGGDEFIACLEGEDFFNRENILKELRTYDEFASGYATFEPSEDMSYTDVFRRADERMYEHKIFTKSGYARDNS